MLGRISFAALAVAVSAFPVIAKEVKIGPASINLTAPPGFCVLTEDNPSNSRVISMTRTMVEGVGNELLAMFANCQQLDDWRAGTRKLLDDFVQYQTQKRFKDAPPLPVAETIKEACAAMRAEGEKILANMLPDVKARVTEVSRTLKVNDMTFLGVLDEDGTGCYAAMLQKFATEAGTDKTQVTVFTTAIIKGKVVYYYLFAPFESPDTVPAMLAAQKNNVAALIAGNRN